jgi:hypothetical protein
MVATRPRVLPFLLSILQQEHNSKSTIQKTLFRRCIKRRPNVFLIEPTTGSGGSREVISIPRSPWRASQQNIFDHSLLLRAPGPAQYDSLLSGSKRCFIPTAQHRVANIENLSVDLQRGQLHYG